MIWRREGKIDGEKHLPVASPRPPTGDLDHTQACALTGNRTGDLSVHSPALHLLSHIRHGLSVGVSTCLVLSGSDGLAQAPWPAWASDFCPGGFEISAFGAPVGSVEAK